MINGENSNTVEAVQQSMRKHPILDPMILMARYAQGIFPMAHDDGKIHWYDPDPRAIIPLDDRFHISRRLQRTINRSPYEIRINHDFLGVMKGCAAVAIGRETTWIDEQIIEAYNKLHQQGYAHSVEAWQGEKLVGGLYGVALRGLFAGESMFSQADDASKICLVALVNRLRERGFKLLDTQFTTPHLMQFGVIEVSRVQYKWLLKFALQISAEFA